MSPVWEKCCLRVVACASFQHGEQDLEILTGIKVSHSTLHRLSQRRLQELPEVEQKIAELSIDGGKVRLRTPVKGEASEWRDYKSVCLDNGYYGAAFQKNTLLQVWLNAQPLVNPVVCLGDGHPGIWSFLKSVATKQTRLEILDWYHLKENLYKIGGSLKRLQQAESELWQGHIDTVLALLANCSGKQVQRFCKYLERHRHRIVNYAYYQAEQICSIGSGAVESSIKQIDARLKLPGAQWHSHNVNSILSLRCAYLNGTL